MEKVFFLADTHLGASYFHDKKERELEVVRFLDSIKEEAHELFLLGDILDYWFEYKHVVPRGYVRFFGKLAELSDAGIKITWIIGNHDIWIFDYIPRELGINVIDGVLETKIEGIPFCIQHGDAIAGTKKFKLLRSFFRNKTCQKLYSGIHPRWTVGFALACSKHSRTNTVVPEETREIYIRQMEEWCKDQIIQGNGSKYFLFGHLHEKVEVELPEGRKMIIIPSFPENGEYGIFNGKTFEIRSFKSQLNLTKG